MSFFAQLEKSVSIFYLVQNFLIVFKQKNTVHRMAALTNTLKLNLKKTKYDSILAYFLVY